ncbi:MAG: TIGR04084 family radical SAM/SPASM domain-containing protein [Candidatus Pacearchaeota archaeon]
MYYHIILTELCNSKCKYCYEKSMNEFGNELNKIFKFDFSAPEKSEVDIKKLNRFLLKDKNAVLIFYGGEPLLEIEKIKEIMDNLDISFRMQTNGKLLNKLPSEYLNRIDKILVSLDGNKERTDFNRGKGTYDIVMQNIALIKKNGYKGELIARMTINKPDLYEQVMHLLSIGFKSIHWQLDAGFYKFDFNKEKFSKFVNEYNKSISRLIDFWISEMRKGRVIMLYPFVDIMQDLLQNKKTLMRCGAGHSGYAITTSGKISACPIMNSIETFYAGDLNSNPLKLKKFQIKGRCLKCSDKDICGGRCLYWNYSNLWPEEGNDLICKTVKHLISELKTKMPEVKSLIESGIIKESQFEHEKYFGPEIIP